MGTDPNGGGTDPDSTAAAATGVSSQQQDASAAANSQRQTATEQQSPTATVDGVTFTLSLDQATGKAAVIDISDPAPDPETGGGVTVYIPSQVTLDAPAADVSGDGADADDADAVDTAVYTIAWLAWGQHSADTPEQVAAGTLHQTGDWDAADQRPHVKELVLPDTVENLDELNFAKFPNLESVMLYAADSTTDAAAALASAVLADPASLVPAEAWETIEVASGETAASEEGAAAEGGAAETHAAAETDAASSEPVSAYSASSLPVISETPVSGATDGASAGISADAGQGAGASGTAIASAEIEAGDAEASVGTVSSAEAGASADGGTGTSADASEADGANGSDSQPAAAAASYVLDPSTVGITIADAYATQLEALASAQAPAHPQVSSVPAGAFKGNALLKQVLVIGSADAVAIDPAAFEGCALLYDESGALRVSEGLSYAEGTVVFDSAALRESALQSAAAQSALEQYAAAAQVAREQAASQASQSAKRLAPAIGGLTPMAVVSGGTTYDSSVYTGASVPITLHAVDTRGTVLANSTTPWTLTRSDGFGSLAALEANLGNWLYTKSNYTRVEIVVGAYDNEDDSKNIQAEQGQWYKTSDDGENSTWVSTTRRNSGPTNNVTDPFYSDIWFVYTYTASQASVTVNHVDENGNAISDDVSGAVIGATTLALNSNEPVELWSAAASATGWAFKSATVTGTDSTGATVTVPADRVRAYYNPANAAGWEWEYEYGADVYDESGTLTDITWTSLASLDHVTLTYSEQPYQSLTVHHVDRSGAQLADPTAAYVTDGGYLVLSAAAAADLSSQGYVLGVSRIDVDGTMTSAYSLAAERDETSLEWSYSYTDTVGAAHELSDAPTDIYLVYDPQAITYTLHFIDQFGNTIGASTTGSVNVDTTNIRTSGGNGSTLGGNMLTTPHVGSYSYATAGSFDPDDSSKNVTATGAWYRYTTENGWQCLPTKNGSQPSDTLYTDFYLVFPHTTLALHYVDTSGNEIAVTTSDPSSNPLVVNSYASGGLQMQVDTSAYAYDLGSSWTFAGAHLGSYRGDSINGEAVVYASSGAAQSSQYALVKADAGTWMRMTDETGSDVDPGTKIYVAESSSGAAFELTVTGASVSLEDYQKGASDPITAWTQASSTTREDGSVVTVYTYADDTSSGYSGDLASYRLMSVTPAEGETAWYLDASYWTQTDLTDIYMVYTPAVTGGIWVEDTLIDDGQFKAGMSSDLLAAADAATSVSYTWYKTVTDSSGNQTTSRVTRAKNGEYWNLAYAAADRSWIDVVADGGALNDTTQRAVSYYVEMRLTNETADSSGNVTSTVSTYRSDPLSVPYYGQLENGSFETPDLGRDHHQFSNSGYASKDGVWQTTGVGSISGHNGQDIEIVSTAYGDGWKSGYSWYGGSATTDGGTQFAELNCEAAGALYQDVITFSGEKLNYWLSHRARGVSQNANNEWDTMYLVIMPTKDALTDGDGGGELDTQAELEAFIKARLAEVGNSEGWTTAQSGAEENVVLYDQDGILIVRISSNDQSWHQITELDGYTAAASVTRFFFVAGYTARMDIDKNRGNTVGNFLDAVGFSQQMPPSSDGFNMTVVKTITGLTPEQVATLASSAGSTEGLGSASPFTITIKASDDEAVTSEHVGAPLNGTKLTFTVTESDGEYTFTPVAADSEGNSVATFSASPTTVSGSAPTQVTLTWRFSNALIGARVEDRYYYTLTEANTTVTHEALSAQLTAESTSSISGGAVSADGTTVLLRAQDDVTFNYANAYHDNDVPDERFITVRKTFTGLASDAVDEMTSYALVVTKDGDSQTTATLTLDADTMEAAGVQLDKSADGLTYTWTISGDAWGAGTYSVAETGYAATGYAVTDVSLNGTSLGAGWPETGGQAVAEAVQAGSLGADALSFTSASGESAAAPSLQDLNVTGTAETRTVAANTNLIVAQYSVGGADAGVSYYVWTPEPLGANARSAVGALINSYTWGNQVTAVVGADGNVSFHSGHDIGTASVGNGTVSYTQGSTQVAFAINDGADEGSSWNQFFAASCSVTGGQDAEVRVTNAYSPQVTLRKVSAANESKKLPDAQFVLKRVGTGAGGADEYLQRVSNAGSGQVTVSWVASQDDATPLVTGSNGEVSLGGLDAGSYALIETAPPAGYNRLVSEVPFTVGADGSVAIDASSGAARYASVDVTTVIVKDSPGTELPETGGPGAAGFVAAGAALVAAAGLGLLARRRGLARKGAR